MSFPLVVGSLLMQMLAIYVNFEVLYDIIKNKQKLDRNNPGRVFGTSMTVLSLCLSLI